MPGYKQHRYVLVLGVSIYTWLIEKVVNYIPNFHYTMDGEANRLVVCLFWRFICHTRVPL